MCANDIAVLGAEGSLYRNLESVLLPEIAKLETPTHIDFAAAHALLLQAFRGGPLQIPK